VYGAASQNFQNFTASYIRFSLLAEIALPFREANLLSKT